MIVVADTSPLNYFIRIEKISIIEALYGKILIPHAVVDEMLARKAPAPVRAWAQHLPHWVEILSPTKILIGSVSGLDPGETEAIAIALEVHAEWLLIDDAAGRDEATRRGLQTVGTLGILRNAHRLGLLDLRTSLSQLQASGFHVSQRLVDELLESV